MGGKSSSAPSTTTTKTEPWDQQKPYLLRGFEEAERLYNSSGPNYFPGSTIAPMSSQMEQALSMIENNARFNPLNKQAQQYFSDMAGGKWLDGNPYIDQIINSASSDVTRNYQDAVQPRIDAAAAKAGRYGSGSYALESAKAQDSLQRNLSDISSNTRYQNYATERQNQNLAAQLLPQLSNLDFQSAQRLSQVGEAREGYNQDQINADIDRFNFDQQNPYNKLLNYLSMIQGNYGSSATATNPYGSTRRNPITGAIGGAMSGAQLGSMFGPVGTGIGGIAGLFSGLF